MLRTPLLLCSALVLLCALPAGARAQENHDPAPRVEAGFGRITFHGLLQAWYTEKSGSAASTFRIRRAELKFVGDLTPRARWTVVVDPAKALSVNSTYTTVDGTQVVSGGSVNQASRLLQDALITLELGRGVRLDAGQFKVPLSLEALTSSAKLETVERALFLTDKGRGGTYGDVRDVGASLHAPLGRRVDVQLGVFNGLGESLNTVDGNDQKTVAGRVVARLPLVEGVQVGGSAAFDPGTESEQLRRERAGAELLFARGPFSLRSEAMTGRDGEVSRRGGYAHAGLRVTPRLQAVARFDAWDPDTRRESGPADVVERDYLAGLNYHLSGHNVKLQANYVRKTFGGGLPGRNLLLVNLQTAW